MKTNELIIDGKKYKFVSSIKYNGKTYVAYEDEENIYISEYIITDNKITLKEIDEEILNDLIKEMNL